MPAEDGPASEGGNGTMPAEDGPAADRNRSATGAPDEALRAARAAAAAEEAATAPAASGGTRGSGSGGSGGEEKVALSMRVQSDVSYEQLMNDPELLSAFKASVVHAITATGGDENIDPESTELKLSPPSSAAAAREAAQEEQPQPALEQQTLQRQTQQEQQEQMQEGVERVNLHAWGAKVAVAAKVTGSAPEPIRVEVSVAPRANVSVGTLHSRLCGGDPPESSGSAAGEVGRPLLGAGTAAGGLAAAIVEACGVVRAPAADDEPPLWDIYGSAAAGVGAAGAWERYMRQALGHLRTAAQAAAEDRSAVVGIAARHALAAHARTQADKALEELRRLAAVVAGVGEETDRGLERLRLRIGRRKVIEAERAARTAVSAAGPVEQEAANITAALVARATELQGEARAFAARATVASTARTQAVESEQRWRRDWPRVGTANALRMAASAEHLWPQMESRALEAKRVAKLVSNSAMRTASTLAEASGHATKASSVAMQAVEQATQNALDLQEIRAMVKRIHNASSVAAERAMGR